MSTPATIAFGDLKAPQKRLKSKVDERMAQVLEHGQYVMGPEVAEFEAALPSFTLTATAEVVLLRGAEPVFCEVDRRTLKIDLHGLRPKIEAVRKAVGACGRARWSLSTCLACRRTIRRCRRFVPEVLSFVGGCRIKLWRHFEGETSDGRAPRKTFHALATFYYSGVQATYRTFVGRVAP